MINILSLTFATITGRDRHRVIAGVDFKWTNDLWVHNIFRVYELIFGRKVGIRAETSAWTTRDENGTTTGQEFHSFEGACAFIEVYIRNKLGLIPRFKIVKVYVPVLAYAGFQNPHQGRHPYLFAIAFDASATGGGAGNVTSVTASLTTTGSNITVTAYGYEDSTTAVMSATHDGSAMAKIANLAGAFRTTAMFRLNIGSGVGAKNVIVSQDGAATTMAVGATSYTGTHATQNGATGTGGASSGTGSVTITTTQDNSWLVAGMWTNGNGARTPDANTTTRWSFEPSAEQTGGDRACTTAGSYTIAWTFSSGLWQASGFELIAGAAAGGGLATRKTLLGVGV